MKVRLGQCDGNDGSVLGDNALLVGVHGEGERFLSVRLRDLAQLDFHRPLVSSDQSTSAGCPCMPLHTATIA